MPLYERETKSRKINPSDEFISFFDRLYHEAYKRGPFVLVVLGVVAFVGLGILFWRQYHLYRGEKQATQIYEASKKSKSDLQNLYREIKKSFPYGPPGILASLQLANFEFEQNDCPAVIRELENYVGRSEESVLRALIPLKLGGCLEDQKDYQKAAQIYQLAGFDSKNFLKEKAQLKLAEMKLKLGEKAEAKKILEDLLGLEKIPPPIQEEARLTLSSNF